MSAALKPNWLSTWVVSYCDLRNEWRLSKRFVVNKDRAADSRFCSVRLAHWNNTLFTNAQICGRFQIAKSVTYIKWNVCAIARKPTWICLQNTKISVNGWIFDARSLNAHVILWYDTILSWSLGFTFVRARARSYGWVKFLHYFLSAIFPFPHYGATALQHYNGHGSAYRTAHRIVSFFSCVWRASVVCSPTRERRKRVFARRRKEDNEMRERSIGRKERECDQDTGWWVIAERDFYFFWFCVFVCFVVHLHRHFVRCN